MPVEPDTRRVLDALAERGLGRLADATPDEARRAFRTLTVDLRDPATIPPVAEVRELEVTGAEGLLAARAYRPGGAGPWPLVVFFHGGGWVIGDLDTHDASCRHLCREVGAAVLSVAYRLAPEHPFPAAVEDALAALRWAAQHAEELGGDPSRLAVAGDSAGGNLAAVTAQRARDEGGPRLAAQLLLYPGLDLAGTDADYPSRVENAEGYYLTREDMVWFETRYLQGRDGADPLASPLLGALEDLPPAVVATAEFDPLRDEGDAYADALSRAGVPVRHLREAGLIHGFFGLDGVSGASLEAARRACAELRELLAAA